MSPGHSQLFNVYIYIVQQVLGDLTYDQSGSFASLKVQNVHIACLFNYYYTVRNGVLECMF